MDLIKYLITNQWRDPLLMQVLGTCINKRLKTQEWMKILNPLFEGKNRINDILFINKTFIIAEI